MVKSISVRELRRVNVARPMAGEEVEGVSPAPDKGVTKMKSARAMPGAAMSTTMRATRTKYFRMCNTSQRVMWIVHQYGQLCRR